MKLLLFFFVFFWFLRFNKAGLGKSDEQQPLKSKFGREDIESCLIYNAEVLKKVLKDVVKKGTVLKDGTTVTEEDIQHFKNLTAQAKIHQRQVSLWKAELAKVKKKQVQKPQLTPIVMILRQVLVDAQEISDAIEKAMIVCFEMKPPPQVDVANCTRAKEHRNQLLKQFKVNTLELEQIRAIYGSNPSNAQYGRCSRAGIWSWHQVKNTVLPIGVGSALYYVSKWYYSLLHPELYGLADEKIPKIPNEHKWKVTVPNIISPATITKRDTTLLIIIVSVGVFFTLSLVVYLVMSFLKQQPNRNSGENITSEEEGKTMMMKTQITSSSSVVVKSQKDGTKMNEPKLGVLHQKGTRPKKEPKIIRKVRPKREV